LLNWALDKGDCLFDTFAYCQIDAKLVDHNSDVPSLARTERARVAAWLLEKREGQEIPNGEQLVRRKTK